MNKTKSPAEEVGELISNLGRDMSLRDYYDFLREVRTDMECLIDATECDIEAEEEQAMNEE